MKRLTCRHRLVVLTAFVLGITLEGCKKDNDDITPPTPDLNQLYQNAITDAMVTESSERIDTLWPILNTNSKLQWKTVHGKQ